MALISPLSRWEGRTPCPPHPVGCWPSRSSPGWTRRRPSPVRLWTGTPCRAAETVGASPGQPVRLALAGQAGVPGLHRLPHPRGARLCGQGGGHPPGGRHDRTHCPALPLAELYFSGRRHAGGRGPLSRRNPAGLDLYGGIGRTGCGDALRLCPTPGGRALHRRGTGIPRRVALPPGGIYDANGPLLAARLAVLGMEPILLPPVSDDAAAIAGCMRARFYGDGL